MNISTKSRYGLKAVLYLAMRYSCDKVSVKEISEEEDISKRYLEQIFAVLKNGGIISSIKGTKGGYFLSRKPSEITVGEVLRLLEGDLTVIETSENFDASNIEYTINNKVWQKINKAISEVVDEITLQDIINDYIQISQGMFYI